MQMLRFIKISSPTPRSGTALSARNEYWPALCNQMSVKQQKIDKNTQSWDVEVISQ